MLHIHSDSKCILYANDTVILLNDSNENNLFASVCVSYVRYLSFYQDEHLSWGQHIHFVNDKLAEGMGMLKFAYKIYPVSCLLKIYYACVYPYLMNGVEH